jgi:uncharacterized protein
MRRRRADRDKWTKLVSRRFVAGQVAFGEAIGYASLLMIDEISSPFYVDYAGRTICVADRGFAWLQQFVLGEQYSVTTVFDQRGHIVQWYVDICSEMGVDSDGVPWWDDLYADVVALPTGGIHVLDIEELEEARDRGYLSEDLYLLAVQVTLRVVAAIGERTFAPILNCRTHKRELELLLPVSSTTVRET